jgi:hypothetical protein
MARLKLVRYWVFLFSAVLGLLPLFSATIRKETLDRYNVRWQQELDQSNRVQSLVVRNTGEPNAKLMLAIRFQEEGAIAGFDASPTANGPAFSIFDAWKLINSSPHVYLLSDQERERFGRVVDQHAPKRSLNDVDNFLDSLLVERLRSSKISAKSLTFLGTIGATSNWHDRWRNRCDRATGDSDCARVESVVSKWEEMKTALYGEVDQKWEQRTGISVIGDHTSAFNANELNLLLKPRAGETVFIRVHYFHSPVTLSTTLQSMTGAHTTLFSNVGVLSSIPFVALFQLHPTVIPLVPIVVFLLLAVLPYALPLPLLTNRKLLVIALRTDDYEFWKEALDRYRFYFLEEFRELRRIYNSSLQMDTEEVMDYARTRLTREHQIGQLRRANIREFVSDELRNLILTTT